MNLKKAKQLRKLAKFHPSQPREYEDISVGKVKILQINQDGTTEEIIKERTVKMLKDGPRVTYKNYKNSLKNILKKGGKYVK